MNLIGWFLNLKALVFQSRKTTIKARDFPNLAGPEVETIVRLVDEAVEKSRKFGLIIRPQDIQLEKREILIMINTLGGVGQMREKLSSVSSFQPFIQTIEEIFSEQIHYYCRQTPPEIATKNRYVCHLEDVITAVIQRIDNGSLL